MCSKTLILVLLLLPVFLAASPSSLVEATNFFPLAKQNCMDRCGNVAIPFPFGTAENCYKNKCYFVTCNQTQNPPKLFMQNTSHEIIDISLSGHLRIMNVVAYECYDVKVGSRVSFRNSRRLNLPPLLTVNATANKFTVLGCDTFGNINGLRLNWSYYVWCTSMCFSKKDLEEVSSCGGGVACCQVNIPKQVSTVDFDLGSYTNYKNASQYNNSCGYAFLVEENAFQFSGETLNNLRNVEKLPVVVDWVISNGNCEEAKLNSTSYACKSVNSDCYNPMINIHSYGYRCRCMDGYQGNPYLDNGCQDIDECQDPVLNNCSKVCKNTPGGFYCTCPSGYRGDGIKGSRGCIPGEPFKYKLVAGIAVGILIVLLVILFIYVRLKRRSWAEEKQRNFVQNGGILLQEKLKRLENNTTKFIYSLVELQKATNGFHDDMIIGTGGFSTVYRGILEKTNKVVAIKKNKLEVASNQTDIFTNELIIHAQINHKNVVKLLGCCLELRTPLLVYEFIGNGTLLEQLHSRPRNLICWDIRLKIAIEIAGALSYLHCEASSPIIHRDIKSANILLDDTFTAKLSDFGSSKLVPIDKSHLSTMVQGTIGYLDPEYMQTSTLTEKSDVYSFGALLVELLSGKKVLSYDRPQEETNIAYFFLSKLRENSVFQVVDVEILGEGNNIKEQIIQVARLAEVCLNMKGEDRPTMKEVILKLEGIRRGGRAQNEDDDHDHDYVPESESFTFDHDYVPELESFTFDHYYVSELESFTF
ncbi:hypothetical protein RD792_005072 [Penstemon davidsonii]|uniref:Uncharacterized protein n=1 Tax=Penstemon davidsonii TaxID=160366 RepID=A0ABR0DJ64_9LAMI|nr:hypothetical protein RD792_005072 [Penstemon davidsonii]